MPKRSHRRQIAEPIWAERSTKAAQRVLRLVEREGLVAVMNATKWQELVAITRAYTACAPRHRIKDLRGPEPPADTWDGEWYYHLRPYRTIEWLEITCFPHAEQGNRSLADVDHCVQHIMDDLQAAHIPFSLERGAIRVWGYLRPGVTPEWVA